MDFGADPNKSYGCDTPLIVACHLLQIDSVKILINSGADVYYNYRSKHTGKVRSPFTAVKIYCNMCNSISNRKKAIKVITLIQNKKA